jgi:hypothetical protein
MKTTMTVMPRKASPDFIYCYYFYEFGLTGFTRQEKRHGNFS